MQSIVRKLPTYLQNKWLDNVLKIRRHDNQECFKDLVQFVVRASEAASDPVYSRNALSSTDSKPMKQQKQKNSSSSFSTNVTSNINKCVFCNEQHDVDDCKKFSDKTIEEKRSFIMQHKLCFGCFGYNHRSKDCVKKRICKICRKRHPTSLHVANFTPNKQNEPKSQTANNNRSEENSNSDDVTIHTAHAYNESSDVILQALLPVTVRQQGSEKCITTYALYDNGSTGCFLTEELKDDLQATSSEVTLKLQTMHGVSNVKTTAVSNLVVTDANDKNPIPLPKAYVKDIPVSHDQIPKAKFLQQWSHLQTVITELPPYMPNVNIGLLIGSNCPLALQPLHVIGTNEEHSPFAVLYRYGWTINGPQRIRTDGDKITCHRVMFQEVEHLKERVTAEGVLRMFELDFNEGDRGKQPGECGYSREDEKFLKIVEEGAKIKEGHYEIPLPIRSDDVNMDNNRQQAMQRVRWQKKKMQANPKYHQDYKDFMNKLLVKGHAYKVPDDELQGQERKTRYLPHHAVYHPQKKNLRVVFDCSAKFNGSSLNDKLLQGPDLTNSLIGVLSRFRQEPIAFMADIESMFYQVRVPREQHDYLRFLWWPDGNLQGELEEYRMAVHIFGAASSPSVSNYALKLTAENSERTYGPQVATTIRNNFYVDDCLKSVQDEATAIQLVNDVREACSTGGFRLTKFTSNSSSVLKSIPQEECSKEVQALQLDYDSVTLTERALGIKWCVDTDSFGFTTGFSDKPCTRRGILSVVSSVYDPLGFVAPFILPGKKILQELCQEDLGWDDDIDEKHKQRWLKWQNDISAIEHFTVPRCLKPKNFGLVKSSQLHVFSDASTIGYGAVAYLRLCNDNGDIHTSFLLGKARLAPQKPTTIPRLELTAATVSMKIACLLQKELEIKIDSTTYHTDSTTVLHYIRSEKQRFPVFVANRVAMIREFTCPTQWKYVDTTENPADHASRGLEVKHVSERKMWQTGPEFLQKPESDWPKQPSILQNVHSESVTSHATITHEANKSVEQLIQQYSSWYRLKRATAIYRRLFDLLHSRIMKKTEKRINGPLQASELHAAEMAIIKYTQRKHFSNEILETANTQRKRSPIPRSSPVYKLDPFVDVEEGVLRVGGRLQRADIPKDMKHPILLPYKDHTTTLLIRHTHEQLKHAGRNHVVSALRERYWIIKANSAVRNVITFCVTCRKLRAPVSEQKMADLPASRVNPSPPFTHTGVDCFGPFTVKERRSEVKRYGVLFTCLASRAVHIETVNSLNTDSFINALRRFISRRGAVRALYCDNGTNFVGTEKAMKEAINEMDQERIQQHMLHNNIEWNFNPPSASHMGGVWERHIRSERKILAHMLMEFGDKLNDEALRTLRCEIEAIINSRPLTTVSSSPDDISPLTPSHLLMMKTSIVVPPPGQFQRDDIYMRQCWRRVQYLANLFWTRWRKEYLLTLQSRQKWNSPKRNYQTGDLVLIKDDNLPRCEWALGRVTNVGADSQGVVRSVFVKTQTSNLRRPIAKLVLLFANEEPNV